MEVPASTGAVELETTRVGKTDALPGGEAGEALGGQRANVVGRTCLIRTSRVDMNNLSTVSPI